MNQLRAVLWEAGGHGLVIIGFLWGWPLHDFTRGAFTIVAGLATLYIYDRDIKETL